MINLELSVLVAVLVAAVLAAVAGFIAGRFSTRAARRDADLLAFLEQAEYSLQCLPGINGDDPGWAVTNHNKTVGMPSFDIREAIASAAGTEVTNG